jgi:hypothetical protein
MRAAPVAGAGAIVVRWPGGCPLPAPLHGSPHHGTAMLYGFIGRVSAANDLKQGLDVSGQRARMIADRVAKATMAGADGFATRLDGLRGAVPDADEPVDLEAEMVSLADEQLRYEATARLLQKAYQNIRTSLRDR